MDNALKPFTHASPRYGVHDGAVVSGFFVLRLGLFVGLAPTVPKLADEMLKDTALCEQSQSHPPLSSRTPHDRKHLHGWRGRKHAYQQDQLMRSRLTVVLEQA